MAAEQPKKQSRELDLSQIRHYKKNVSAANLQIAWTAYIGKASLKGTEIIGAAALAQNLTTKPPYLKVIRSHRFPGDLCGVPTAEESKSHIPITWAGKGRTPRLAMPELLAAENVVIPRGTKMVISLYLEQDPEYGACVGMKLKEAEFQPIRSKKKPAAAATGQKDQETEKDGNGESKK